ncbi:MAG TPA: zinc-dependent alcohol dehydrogenase [Myxococcus sp.]|nr:zinc-dependent alcohol dehydrogenase [Myxococcus sp.]
MKAVVFHGIGDIRLDDVEEPAIEKPTDAIVRLSASAICGTDLHMIRGTMPGMKPGTILGHEGVGYVEALGDDVRNFKVGDRVVVCSTIACGNCVYCRAGYYAQCNDANPNGAQAGTAFFGGPAMSGPFNGMQAEKVRVPFAHVGMVRVPEGVTDEQAILVSDIFPTGYMGAELAEIKPGDTVAVFGCGPVGLFAIVSAKLLGAGRVFAIDCHEDRLDLARAQGAEVINFDQESPVETLMRLTNGIGVDRAIDAVGVDSMHAHHGPAAKAAKAQKDEFKREVKEAAPKTNPDGDNWVPGDAPAQALLWAVETLAKAGTLSIIGVYPQQMKTFPIGMAMNKNLTLKMGNCNHRKYIPKLLELVRAGVVDPTSILSNVEPIGSAIEAYRQFDLRKPGWVKVELEPGQLQ